MDYYKNTTTKSSAYLFFQKENYDEYIEEYLDWLRKNQIGELDINFYKFYFNSSLYGKVNLLHVPIIPREEQMTLLEGIDSNNDLKSFNFINDMLFSFMEYINLSCRKNNIKPLISLQDISKAYQEPYSLYIDYFYEILNDFYSWIKISQKINSISNFNDFLQLFINFAKTIKVENIVFSDFIQSQSVGLYSNGLCIKFKDYLENDDQSKINFIETPFFEIYVEAGRRYGFVIDKNNPFKIVADLNSMATHYFMYKNIDLEYLKNQINIFKLNAEDIEIMYDFINNYKDFESFKKEHTNRLQLNTIFNLFYKPAYKINSELTEIDILINILIDFYNAFVEDNPFYSNTSFSDDKIKTHTQKREKQCYNIDSTLKIKFYLKIKNLEHNYNMNIFKNKINNKDIIKFINEKRL